MDTARGVITREFQPLVWAYPSSFEHARSTAVETRATPGDSGVATGPPGWLTAKEVRPGFGERRDGSKVGNWFQAVIETKSVPVLLDICFFFCMILIDNIFGIIC